MPFLQSLISSVTSLGHKNAASVVGVDIGSSSIKVVQLRSSRGVAILETYGEIALGPYGKQPIGKVVKLSSEQLGEALRDLLKEANVTTHEGSMSVSFSSTMMTVVELPKVGAEALKRIIPLEARKYVPVPISEVTLDWFVIPEDEVGKSAFDVLTKDKDTKLKGQEVLLVAIQNAMLQNMQSISSAVGLTVDFYEIEVFSAIRASFEHGIAPMAFVDIGAGTTKVYIVERGIVRLTHLIMVGGQQMTETLGHAMSWEFEKAERVKRENGLIDNTAYSRTENDQIQSVLLSTLSRVFTEVNRVLLSYGQRYNKNIAQVVLLGGGASLPGITTAAKSSLSVEVDISHPFTHTEAPAFLDSVLQSIGPGFAVSVGLALRKLQQK
ncbi:MAG: Type pilus assembly protein PilM [Candidatus Kaiserbacteria bacterium]|nr:Type pilus assembly protein PilM [Candidatus Kaiserbacteria bacterium]